MYKNKDKKIRTDYKKPYFILDMLNKVVRNLLITGLLLFFGYWLFFMSNMGPSYLPDIRDGSLDIGIRITLLCFAALIWLLAPIWFFWSTIRYGYRKYNQYQVYKDTNSMTSSKRME